MKQVSWGSTAMCSTGGDRKWSLCERNVLIIARGSGAGSDGERKKGSMGIKGEKGGEREIRGPIITLPPF
jgi:hypothetical protein